MEWLIFPAAFLAGLVDAIVGGGGLIQLPALLIAYPSMPLSTVLGTNKLANMCGTAAAVWKYQRSLRFDLRVFIPAIFAALIGSYGGARLTTLCSPDFLRPSVLFLLIVVWLIFFFRPAMGAEVAQEMSQEKRRWRAFAIGLLIGIYDGFFGPGTGTWFIIAGISLLGLSFLQSSALAKVPNLTTNLSALVAFAAMNSIDWQLGLLVAFFNLSGSLVGSHLALSKGNKFVRIFFLIIVAGLIVKLGSDFFA